MKLMDVCNKVLDASAWFKAGTRKQKVTVGGQVFDLADSGMCQKNARLAYTAATGKPMPGAACCAWRTFRNLEAMDKGLFLLKSVRAAWVQVVGRLLPGDFLYFSGGRTCKTCGGEVGHVGIWMGCPEDAPEQEWMYQNTSRDNLGTTRQGPTPSQKVRLSGAFRFKGVS